MEEQLEIYKSKHTLSSDTPAHPERSPYVLLNPEAGLLSEALPTWARA